MIRTVVGRRAQARAWNGRWVPSTMRLPMGCACARSSFMVLTRMELSYCVWMKITIPPSGDNRSVGRRPLTGSWFSGSDSRWQGGGVMFFDLDLDVTIAGMPNSVREVPHRDGWGWSKQSQFLRHPDRGGVIHQVNHLLGHAVVVVQQGDMGDRPRSS